jgi:hypothetical protein
MNTFRGHSAKKRVLKTERGFVELKNDLLFDPVLHINYPCISDNLADVCSERGVLCRFVEFKLRRSRSSK